DNFLHCLHLSHPLPYHLPCNPHGNLIVAPPAVHYTHNVPTGLAQEGENVIIKLFLYASTSGGFGPAAPEPGRDWQQLPA
ncbi:MAG TPA: hypothetical protein PLL85_04135, partial [Gemmiger qucibialis]|nr:hypothetical protein [Gemmiger qucibialis]